MKNLLFFILFYSIPAFSQNDTVQISKTKKCSYLPYVIPSALITYGVITRFSPDLQDFDKQIASSVDKNIHRAYRFDDYVQYSPFVAVYGLDLMGVKAKHNIRDRTIVLATSILITGTSVSLIKNLTHVQRPDGSNSHSFPSGHTATAFVGAAMLYMEYKDESAWIGVAGYATALSVGTMRLVNKKHYFSDVVTGAGIGILSVEVSYLMLPMWHKLFKIRDKAALAIIPNIEQNHLGFGVYCVF
jgi:membrane-associated phospholipid phosphatase